MSLLKLTNFKLIFTLDWLQNDNTQFAGSTTTAKEGNFCEMQHPPWYSCPTLATLFHRFCEYIFLMRLLICKSAAETLHLCVAMLIMKHSSCTPWSSVHDSWFSFELDLFYVFVRFAYLLSVLH